jgi:hypothetical protein
VVGAVSIGSFEGSRFLRGGRYGISIDFSLEVVEKANTCWEIFKSNIPVPALVLAKAPPLPITLRNIHH